MQAENSVEKGFSDADLVIHVTPDQDCEVTFGGKGATRGLILVVLVAVVVVVIAAAMMLLTAAPPGG